jgi:hypothetical protein
MGWGEDEVTEKMVSTKHIKYSIGLRQLYYHHTTTNICYAGKCSAQEARKGGTAVQA